MRQKCGQARASRESPSLVPRIASFLIYAQAVVSAHFHLLKITVSRYTNRFNLLPQMLSRISRTGAKA